MPHPKRRQSRHRQGIRRSHLAIKPLVPNHCSRCGSPVKSHRVCDNCGYYGFSKKKNDGKGVEVLRREEF